MRRVGLGDEKTRFASAASHEAFTKSMRRASRARVVMSNIDLGRLLARPKHLGGILQLTEHLRALRCCATNPSTASVTQGREINATCRRLRSSRVLPVTSTFLPQTRALISMLRSGEGFTKRFRIVGCAPGVSFQIHQTRRNPLHHLSVGRLPSLVRPQSIFVICCSILQLLARLLGRESLRKPSKSSSSTCALQTSSDGLIPRT